MKSRYKFVFYEVNFFKRGAYDSSRKYKIKYTYISLSLSEYKQVLHNPF